MEIPGDRSVSARSVALTFGILAWIAVSLRCYVRFKIVKAFGRDDGCMVVALVSQSGVGFPSSTCLTNFPPQVFYTVFCACMVTASFYGTGKHEANLTAEHILIAKRVGDV
jgi:hypothetical protein